MDLVNNYCKGVGNGLAWTFIYQFILWTMYFILLY